MAMNKKEKQLYNALLDAGWDEESAEEIVDEGYYEVFDSLADLGDWYYAEGIGGTYDPFIEPYIDWERLGKDLVDSYDDMIQTQNYVFVIEG